jgi:FMN phosphatase YigB (HAD superfamily)
MVNTIIFDFGDVFINKDKPGKKAAFENLGLAEWDEDLEKLEGKLETGKINEEQFLKGIQTKIPDASIQDIKDAWNAGIADFPLYRLEFLQKLSKSYRLFLLSNTDPIHMEKFERDAGASFYSDFYQCFEKIYFSHEIGVRKPHEKAYYHLINQHEVQPKRTLFVDDKDFNTKAAEELGFRVWNLKAGEEDVVELFEKKIIPTEEA